MGNNSIVRKHIIFYGYVQGVGFRYRARHAADLYGCTGWVRNEWDGSVSMEIQGEECWRCQHCLAVCPQGAISIFGKKPEDSLPPAPKEMGEYMERLIVNRRSCRRFLDQNVDPKVITGILSAMAAAPTGGNAMGVEYTVIDDKDRVEEIRKVAYAKMDADAKKHIYTHSFSDFYYGKMKESEKTVRKGDLLFCGAPYDELVADAGRDGYLSFIGEDPVIYAQYTYQMEASNHAACRRTARQIGTKKCTFYKEE